MLTNDQEDRAPSTVETLADAYQFARHNQYIADLAPLQLYSSALVFAPDLSIMKTQFKSCMPLWLLSPPRIEKSWRSDVLKLDGHTNHIMAITFSPDDKLLGTSSLDGTARVWDTTDASCSLTVSYDRRDYYPDAIAFSSDNSKIAVAYMHYQRDIPAKVSVTTYNTKTGTLLRMMQCPELLSDELRLAVAFENDAHDHEAIVAVVAGMKQVQVWRSVNDSNILVQAWTSHFANQEGYPINVCISQDASLLCFSGCLDENDPGESSISVLDPKTGAVTSKHGRGKETGGMTFSKRTLVYQMTQGGHAPGSPFLSLRGFDVEIPGAFTHVLDHYEYWQTFSLANAKNRVAFNPIDHYTVYVEAISVNKRVGRQMQAPPYKRQVAVAPRGDRVADWNSATGCLMLDIKGLVTQTIMPDADDGQRYLQWPRCLTISPDCQYIAFGLCDGVTVWNVETGQHSQYNEFKNQFILAFSNDNGSLAGAAVSDINDFSSISVWDLGSQRMLSSMDLPWRPHAFDRLEFSADGQDLLTHCFRFHIATKTLTTHPESTKSSIFGKEIGLTGELSSLEWVQFGGEDLLWIPQEYRPDWERRHARGNTVALGQEDGSVMILRFSDPSVI